MKREVFTLMLHDYRGDAIEGLRLYTLDEEGKVQIQYWRAGKELNDHVEQRITIPVELLEGLMILASAYQKKGMPFEDIPKLFKTLKRKPLLKFLLETSHENPHHILKTL